MQKILWRVLIGLGGIGLVFNIVQIIIIINGGYNRNPVIEPEILQILDSIALTLVFAAISVVMMAVGVWQLRRMK